MSAFYGLGESLFNWAYRAHEIKAASMEQILFSCKSTKNSDKSEGKTDQACVEARAVKGSVVAELGMNFFELVNLLTYGNFGQNVVPTYTNIANDTYYNIYFFRAQK